MKSYTEAFEDVKFPQPGFKPSAAKRHRDMDNLERTTVEGDGKMRRMKEGEAVKGKMRDERLTEETKEGRQGCGEEL